jgi:octaprenyl-diphosphate synthase
MASVPGPATASSDLRRIYAPIREDLAAASAAIARELRGCDPALGELVRHAERYTGKQLRPALLLFCGRACGGTSQAHIDTAAVVELIHTATLIHDDVIDGADHRRRSATINARWGAGVSIMLGDLLFTRAMELFSRFATPLAQRLLAGAIREVCEGELLQLLARRQQHLGEDRYMEIIAKKTGALCAATCSLGALLSGKSDGVVDRFAAFGRCLGIAFQIADDCLDVRGDERTVGKTLGLDLLGGKLTLPVIYVREQGPEAARQELDRLLAQPVAHEHRPRLAEFLSQQGAFDYCERTAQRLVRQGVDELAFLGPKPEYEFLQALAAYMVHRKS